jgi:hypothetical protein
MPVAFRPSLPPVSKHPPPRSAFPKRPSVTLPCPKRHPKMPQVQNAYIVSAVRTAGGRKVGFQSRACSGRFGGDGLPFSRTGTVVSIRDKHANDAIAVLERPSLQVAARGPCWRRHQRVHQARWYQRRDQGPQVRRPGVDCRRCHPRMCLAGWRPGEQPWKDVGACCRSSRVGSWHYR